MMMRVDVTVRRMFFLAFIANGICSCGQEPQALPEVRSFEEVLEVVKNAGAVRCFLVSRNNELIAARYFARFEGDSVEHLRSATKSIMSILVGIALDEGFIQSLDDPISKYLKNVPVDKHTIKIRHLLNMKSGLTWDEGSGYNDNNRMVDSGNPLTHMMNLPMAHPPGEHWEYSTGDIHLLSAIVSNAANMTTRSFAYKYLFDRLGIRDIEWQRFGDGYFSGGSRLQMKPMDMLKIGQMCVNGGTYKQQRILSKEYIDLATSNVHVFNKNTDLDLEEGYGYGFWTVRYQKVRGYMAMGYGGQTIVGIPKYGIVCVVTYPWKVGGERALDQQNKANDIAEWVWAWAAGQDQ